jgi:hypothetical protein
MAGSLWDIDWRVLAGESGLIKRPKNDPDLPNKGKL